MVQPSIADSDLEPQFNIRLSIPGRVLLGIILPPLVIVTPAIIAITLYGPALPEWGIYVVVAVCLAGGVILTKYVVNVLLAAKAVLTAFPTGFHVAFAQKNFYTPASFSLSADDVTNFAHDSSGGRFYMTFDTRKKPSKFEIIPASYAPRDMDSFRQLFGIISGMIEESNQRRDNGAGAVTAKTMYDRTWAKILAATVLLALIVFPVLRFFNIGNSDLPWWRFAGAFIIALPFLAGVFLRKPRKNR